MKPTNTTPALDRIVDSLGECPTPETARRILGLKADRKLQDRVDYLASRSAEGTIAAEEQVEYGKYVSYGTFVAILKSKSRQLLAVDQSK